MLMPWEAEDNNIVHGFVPKLTIDRQPLLKMALVLDGGEAKPRDVI